MTKTAKGLQVMKDRSVPLSPRQRSAFILFDGKRTLQEVLDATAPMGVVAADLELLVEQGLLEPASTQAAAPVPAAAPAAAPVASAAPAAAPASAGTSRTPQQRYMEAYPLATALTAGLGLRGFRLNLAVEGAGSYEELLQVAPRIREAVGEQKFAPLDRALNG